jgi:uncharacterized membrane protein YkoI
LIDSKILLSVVIVILIGVAAAGYQITAKTSDLWQPVTSQNPTTSDEGSGTTGAYSSGQASQTGGSSLGTLSQGQGTTGGVSVKITAAEAKALAQKSIEQPGAQAGTPKLVTLNNTLTYVVPIILNNQQVGEIEIDPQTGKIIGGAGGAPNG